MFFKQTREECAPSEGCREGGPVDALSAQNILADMSLFLGRNLSVVAYEMVPDERHRALQLLGCNDMERSLPK